MFKTALNKNIIPHTWNLANIVPILIPNKDTDNGTSYRPISLLSVIAKTLEKSLLPYITANIPNTPMQHGYKTQQKKYIQPYLHKVFCLYKTKQPLTKSRQNNLHSVHTRPCRINEQSGPNNKALPMATHPKILGLTLDPKLTYSRHVHNISVQPHKPLQITKALTATG